MTVTDITELVTGPTRGLGRDVASALAQRRIKLVLMGRDLERLEAVATQARQAGSPHVIAVVCDFGSLVSIASAGALLSGMVTRNELEPLGVVIGNAGIQTSDRSSVTMDGFEATFGVNVLSNHALIRSVAAATAPDAHFVVVGSGTHFGQSRVVAGPDWMAPEQLAAPGGKIGSYSVGSSKAGQSTYSTAKLAVNYLVHEWQRRSADQRRFNIYDPGLMPGTGLVRSGPTYRQWAWHKVMPILTKLPVPGVATTKHSSEQLAEFALGRRFAEVRGGYVEIEKLSEASEESFDGAREAALWNYCEQLCAQTKLTTTKGLKP